MLIVEYNNQDFHINIDHVIYSYLKKKIKVFLCLNKNKDLFLTQLNPSLIDNNLSINFSMRENNYYIEFHQKHVHRLYKVLKYFKLETFIY